MEHYVSVISNYVKKKKHLYKMIYLKVQEKLQYWEMKKYESNETH